MFLLFSILTLVKSNICFTVHVGNITEQGSLGVCGEGKAVHLPWMTQWGVEIAALRWAQWGPQCSNRRGRRSHSHKVCCISLLWLVSNVNVWPEEMVTHQTFSTPFIKLLRNLVTNSVWNTDRNLSTESLFFLSPVVSELSSDLAKDSPGPLRKMVAA